jgi:hypothetical protein
MRDSKGSQSRVIDFCVLFFSVCILNDACCPWNVRNVWNVWNVYIVRCVECFCFCFFFCVAHARL